MSADAALSRVIQYLMNNNCFYLESKGTGLGDAGVDVMDAYSDASHATDRPHVTRSQTGVMVLLNNAPIYWCSRKQIQGTACSSAMAEVYALSEAVRCVRLVAFVCDEMNVKLTRPLTIKVDSKPAKSFKDGTCMTSKIRGVVDMREDWVQELRQKGDIAVEWVPEHKQKADVLTKGLPSYKFKTGLNLTRGNTHQLDCREVVSLVYS